MRIKGFVGSAVVIILLMTQTAGAAEDARGKQDRLFNWMMGGYVGLQVTDIYLTQKGTQMGLEEANPVLTSGNSVVAAKLVMVPLTAWGLKRLYRTRPKLATGLAVGLNALYLGVAYSNMKVIQEAD